jgi:hypothetical protein
MDLPSSCGRDDHVYNVLLVIINKYTKFIRYFPILKIITIE